MSDHIVPVIFSEQTYQLLQNFPKLRSINRTLVVDFSYFLSVLFSTLPTFAATQPSQRNARK